MAVRLLFIIGLIGTLLVAAGESSAQGEWTPVFKGESLEGWEITNDGVWRIFDNILNGQGPNTGSSRLIGPELPGDFALRLEFKVLGNRRAAFYFRSHWLDGVLHGYKIDIPPFRVGGFELVPIEGSAGDLYRAGQEDEGLVSAIKVPVENPMEVFRSWNQLDLRAVGGEIEIEINGVKVVTANDDRFIGGRVAFEVVSQGAVGLVMFQNVEYKDLTDESGYTSLFDGKTLDGWKVHGEEKQWKVEKGVIHSESVDDAYSYLATEGEYKDFSIIAEFLGLAGGNSGLFFHSHLEGTSISGIQAEVQPPTGDRLGHSGNLYDSSGRGWLIDPNSLAPEKEAAFRMDEWNTIRVDVKDHRIKTWLNGVQVVDFQDDSPKHETGVIALQIHSGGGVKVDWRNLRIKELE